MCNVHTFYLYIVAYFLDGVRSEHTANLEIQFNYCSYSFIHKYVVAIVYSRTATLCRFEYFK